MCAILESYASEDRQRVDYVAISKSEEFRRYGTYKSSIFLCIFLVDLQFSEFHIPSDVSNNFHDNEVIITKHDVMLIV